MVVGIGLIRRGRRYAEGQDASAEGGLCQRGTPRAAIGVCYADSIGLYAEGFRPSATSLIHVVDSGAPSR
jgi:hypothetical protein